MSRAKPKRPPHVSVVDPDTPADPVTGVQVCRCGLPVKPGDARHLMPDPQPDPQSAAAGGDR